MEKAEEKFLAVKQIYTTLLKMFADEMKQEELEKMNVTDVPMEMWSMYRYLLQINESIGGLSQ